MKIGGFKTEFDSSELGIINIELCPPSALGHYEERKFKSELKLNSQ